MNEVITKRCSGICGEVKELNKYNFRKRKDATDGFRDQCRNCFGKGTPSHIIENNGILYQVCTGECELKLEICEDNFGFRNKLKNKYCRQCKICVAKYKVEYRKENKDIIKIKNKKYNSKPENKHKINEQIKQRRLNDPKFKLRYNISGAIWKAFKRRNSKKSRSISKSLAYTIDELITHLEMWFKKPGNEWMTLNNQGVYNPDSWDNNDTSTWVWHIDHVFADADFNYTSEDDQEFKDCWSLDNLRPLRADLNIFEGARRTRHKKK